MAQLDAVLSGAALRAIRFYQSSLSRHKGFCCAHAAVHGGESCSAAVARIIREDGVLGGRGRAAQRFAECRDAYELLRGGSALAVGTAGPRVQGLCCCGPVPIPFKCGG